MGVRMQRANTRVTGRRDDGNRVYTRTDHLVGPARDNALDLIKQVAQMTDNALSVDTRWFWYYKRRTVGRKCTCALAENSTPNNDCTICWGTGIVGGYDKYGTRAETLDTTFPGLSMINVKTKAAPLPSAFVLEDGATKGVLRATVALRKNIGIVDRFDMASSLSSRVSILVKPTSGFTWLPATKANIQPMLSTTSLDFEITLTRDRPSDPSPIFRSLYLRYNLKPASEIRVPGDLPPNTESVSLQEFGYDEQFGSVQISIGPGVGESRTNSLTTFTVDDFFYYIERGRHWKITEVKPNYALGIFTSFDITGRWVQNYEAYKRFPV